MHLFQIARHPTRAIRIALVALLLAFGLNAIAHASHRHEADAASVGTTALHANACGYCATFGALTDTPRPTPISFTLHTLAFLAAGILTAAFIRRTPTSANPRAPPHR